MKSMIDKKLKKRRKEEEEVVLDSFCDASLEKGVNVLHGGNSLTNPHKQNVEFARELCAKIREVIRLEHS